MRAVALVVGQLVGLCLGATATHADPAPSSVPGAVRSVRTEQKQPDAEAKRCKGEVLDGGPGPQTTVPSTSGSARASKPAVAMPTATALEVELAASAAEQLRVDSIMLEFQEANSALQRCLMDVKEGLTGRQFCLLESTEARQHTLNALEALLREGVRAPRRDRLVRLAGSLRRLIRSGERALETLRSGGTPRAVPLPTPAQPQATQR